MLLDVACLQLCLNKYLGPLGMHSDREAQLVVQMAEVCGVSTERA